MTRDPRVDPRPGDVVRRKGHKRSTEVVGLIHGMPGRQDLLYRTLRGTKVKVTSVAYWRTVLAPDAEIVRVSP